VIKGNPFPFSLKRKSGYTIIIRPASTMKANGKSTKPLVQISTYEVNASRIYIVVLILLLMQDEIKEKRLLCKKNFGSKKSSFERYIATE
jgi:hypothetical protein